MSDGCCAREKNLEEVEKCEPDVEKNSYTFHLHKTVIFVWRLAVLNFQDLQTQTFLV